MCFVFLLITTESDGKSIPILHIHMLSSIFIAKIGFSIKKHFCDPRGKKLEKKFNEIA